MSQEISHTPKASVSIPKGVGSKPLVVGVNLFNMKKICGIYKITSPSKKIYIGQSVNCHDRFRKYKNIKCEEQTHLYRSLKKYGFERHRIEIIHECAREKLNELEKYYVDLFQTFNSEYGLNLRDGGGSKGEMSEESKRKLGLRMKGNTFCRGKKLSPEHKKNISASLVGNKYGVGNKNCVKRVMSEITRKKIGDANRGKVRSAEALGKMSKAHLGRKLTPEHIEKMRKANAGRVVPQELRLKLRIAANLYYAKNHKSRLNTSSKYRGVSLTTMRELYVSKKTQIKTERIYKYWIATVSINGKNKVIGHFKDEKEAAIAYNKKAKEINGESAYLNII